MPLPTGWSTRRVVQTYTRRDGDGTPAVGWVEFHSDTVYEVDGVTLVPKIAFGQLSAAGVLDIELPTADVEPNNGVVYRVVQSTVNKLELPDFSFVLSPGVEPVQLDEVSPVVPPDEPVIGLVTEEQLAAAVAALNVAIASGDAASVATAAAALNAAVATLNADIAALEAADTALNAADTALTASISDLASDTATSLEELADGKVDRLDVIPTPPVAVPHVTQLGYQPVVSDSDLEKVIVNGVETYRKNENGHVRMFFAPGAYSDALLRGVDHASATGWFLEQQNVARDQSLFGVKHNGELWRTISDQLVKLADLVTASGAASGMPDPATYGVKLLTVNPEVATNSGTPGSGSLQIVKQVVQQTILVSALRVYVQAAAVTPAANYNGFAVYSDDGSDTLTKIAETADDTTLWTTTSWRSRNLITPVTLHAGRAYWFAFLGSYGTAPTVRGSQGIGNQGVLNSLPAGATSGFVPGVSTSFPATISRAGLTGQTTRWCFAAT